LHAGFNQSVRAHDHLGFIAGDKSKVVVSANRLVETSMQGTPIATNNFFVFCIYY